MNSRQENRSKLSFTARIINKYSLERFLSICGEKMSKAYQTHCPQMRTFALQWSLQWSVCYRACAKVLRFTITNKHGRSTETNVMSSTAFCGRIQSAVPKKDGESGAKTQSWQGFVSCWGCWSGYDAKTARNSFSHEYDEWRDYDNKRNYFPFVCLEKMFLPEEGLLEDRGNIYRQLYRCLIPSISSQLCVQEQIVWSLLRPLKWYKFKSSGNK